MGSWGLGLAGRWEGPAGPEVPRQEQGGRFEERPPGGRGRGAREVWEVRVGLVGGLWFLF